MKYVYILQSIDSAHFDTGVTDDLRARLAKHNAGEVPAHIEIQAMAHQDLRRV
jgi:predicted GIY-YIG superfamily endonuclease